MQSNPRRSGSWLAPVALQILAFCLFSWRNLGREPYDDAYFFKRFALHALDAGRLTWNLDEPAVHGCTSQLWQALALLLTAIAPEHYVLAGRLLSLLCVALAAALLTRSTWPLDRGSTALFALSAPSIWYALLSGMETGLVLALLAACLGATRGAREAGPRWLPPVAALCVYLARPDAVLLALPIVLAAPREPRRLVGDLTRSALALVVWLGLARLYYGTALPLPFYAKTAAFTPYDPEFLAQCRESRLAHLALFALTAAPLFGLAVSRLDRVNRVVLAGVLSFVGYHALFAVDVMGMHARFFAPALLPLAFSAARALAERGASPTSSRGHLASKAATLGVVLGLLLLWCTQTGSRSDAVAPGLLVAHVLIAAVMVASALRPARPVVALFVCACAYAAATLLSPAAPPLTRYDDDAYLSAHVTRGSVFRGLPTLIACFGDSIHAFHSEAGVPGLVLRHGKVTDLAGLLSPQWLFSRGSFDQHCLRERPEAIFLPHRNYRALNREIRASSCMRRYVRVVERSASALHVRDDLAARYLACAAARR